MRDTEKKDTYTATILLPVPKDFPLEKLHNFAILNDLDIVIGKRGEAFINFCEITAETEKDLKEAIKGFLAAVIK